MIKLRGVISLISQLKLDYVSSTNAPASYVAEGEALLAAAVLVKHRQSLVRSVSTASPSARHLYILDPGASGMAGVTTLASVVGCKRLLEATYCQNTVILKHMLKEKTRKEPADRQPRCYCITSPCWVCSFATAHLNALLSPPPPQRRKVTCAEQPAGGDLPFFCFEFEHMYQ